MDPQTQPTSEEALREGNSLPVRRVESANLEPQDPHWLRMDHDLARAVVAKTEEELLGSLAALMRNKVENEQLSRRLAQLQIDAQQAKCELDAIKEQIRRAEEEVATRMGEHGRINEEINHLRRELATFREEHERHSQSVSGLKNEAAYTQQLLADAHQRLGIVKSEVAAKLAEHTGLAAQVDQFKREKTALFHELAPLQTEVDGRVKAREALIQEIEILHRHLSDLAAQKERQTAEVSQLESSHVEFRHELEILHGQRGPLVSELDQLRESIAQHGSDKERLTAQLADLHNQVAALESHLHELTDSREKAEQAEREKGLPLLFESESHQISPDWNSYLLESEFHTDEALDAKKLAELVGRLPGLEGCLIVKNYGPVLASELPEQIHDHLKVPNRNYNLLFERLQKKVRDYNLPNARLATFDLGDGSVTVAQADDAFVFVNHKSTKLCPGIPEKLASVASELAKMYP